MTAPPADIAAPTQADASARKPIESPSLGVAGFPEVAHRIAANDYGRGIGIFLVVLGHVLIGLDSHGIVNESTSPGRLALSRAAVAWIYAFHMPLFFFLSGTLIERSVKKPFADVLSSRLRSIAWPYLVWSLLQESLREVTGISEGSASDWWRILYRPMMQFWFLYVLFFLLLAYYVLRRLRVPRVGILVVAAFLHWAPIPDVPLFTWVVHEFCKHGLYLAAGAVAAEAFEHRAIPFGRSVSVRLLLAAAGYLLIGACVARGRPLEPTVLAFVGILASVSLASVLAECRTARFLEQWGLLSLQIYVAHTIASAAIRVLLLRCRVDDPLTHLLVQTATGIYAPIVFYEACHRLGCDWVFTLRRPNTPETSKT
jgi:fucose 4-O-acetylase-like acetyltransferase